MASVTTRPPDNRVPRLWVFDPGLLLGDQASHELGPFLPRGFNTFVQEHLDDLRESPLLIVRYAL